MDKNSLFAIFREHIGAWYENAYGDRAPYSKMIEFNASGTERRADILLAPLKPEYEQSPPKRVLDVGCGFASIAIFLAWQWPKAEIVAIDRTDSYFKYGAQAASHADIRNISFEIQEASELEHNEKFDLVICCNMLNYLTSRDSLDNILTRLAAATRSGGRLAIHTPHFWSYREAFTSLPFLHFLPRRWQDKIARGLKKRSGLLDVRHPSLREISNTLSKNGMRRLAVEPSNVITRSRTTHLTTWFEKQ